MCAVPSQATLLVYFGATTTLFDAVLRTRNETYSPFAPILLHISVDAHDRAGGPSPDKSRGPRPGTLPEPELAVLDKWRGTWDVKATRRQPLPVQEVSYSETYEWILDGRFLRSETSRKPDGGKGMSMFWFDKFTKTYRLMLFDASGFGVELPTARVERKRSDAGMERWALHARLLFGIHNLHRSRCDSI